MVKPRVCLSMIVKDEAKVIRRCLSSIAPLIDCWAIVDTGSTDGTQDIIREALAGTPGTLIERPWENFAVGRNQALDLARESGADYALFIDADEIVRYSDAIALPPLEHDAYIIRAALEDVEVYYARTFLVRLALPWKWRGAVHEYCAVAEGNPSHAILDGLVLIPHYDGARARDPQKAQRDIDMLRAELDADPTNARAAFYLAQTYRGAMRLEEARDAYAKRAAMFDAPNKSETWYAKYQLARMTRALDMDPALVQERYLDAADFRPSRAEPLFELANFCRELGMVGRAYAYAHAAADMGVPHETFMVDLSIYEWRAMYELAAAAAMSGRLAQSIEIARHLIDSGKLPPEQCLAMWQNLRKCRRTLKESQERGEIAA